ncbi:MAG: chlorophyll synthase ChlG [Boseongicola sp.]|nr:chlorophyll synthase ChlG [Boseongicola sp.]
MSVSENLHISESSMRRVPELKAMFELLKPITWFPPMWAYLCGIVSVGVWPGENWGLVVLGVILASPVVCGMSQVANDWCDRHVDAINEPQRPIPSGRVPPNWALGYAVALSVLSLAIGSLLGPWGLGATVVAVIAAWIYSVEPIRLKRSGWWGPGLVGLSYETLPWFTGAAVLSVGAPSFPVVVVAVLYGLGAHGIMTLNDFKALEGDRVMGIKSLPVLVGPEVAAKIACTMMALPQLIVVSLLLIWGRPAFATIVGLSLLAQFWAMRVMMRDPNAKAPWYNATGVSLYVSGMMVTAYAIRTLEISL